MPKILTCSTITGVDSSGPLSKWHHLSYTQVNQRTWNLSTILKEAEAVEAMMIISSAGTSSKLRNLKDGALQERRKDESVITDPTEGQKSELIPTGEERNDEPIVALADAPKDKMIEPDEIENDTEKLILMFAPPQQHNWGATPSSRRRSLTISRVIETSEAFFRVFSFSKDDEKYLLEMHQLVTTSLNLTQSMFPLNFLIICSNISNNRIKLKLEFLCFLICTVLSTGTQSKRFANWWRYPGLSYTRVSQKTCNQGQIYA
ncbi:hypothetical protein BUALT_Bualt09G0112200 [Buddleja alternifolia]|uniref:Uncharacterized protein n=1 Tax=Buddleja alternifolia TaxID=168488 RepID=A0AAV6XCD0_9LAMI|nr:hypothetical protein BUALT_Bualt09G0112200 [Buddleja alternifolia]